MGGLSSLPGLGGEDQESRSTAAPWGPTRDTMEGIVDMAGSALDTPWKVYEGQQVAGFDPYQQSAYEGAYGIVDRNLQGLGGMYGQSADLMGGFNPAMDYYGQAMGQAPVQMGGPDFGNVAAYADNPYMNQMIDNAMGDSMRQLTEVQIPGMQQSAGMSGNAGSSMLERGYEKALGDFMGNSFANSANLRGNAWNQGLGMENMQNQFNANAQMQGQQFNMQGANALMGGAQTGAGMFGNAYGMSQNVYDPMLAAGGGKQAYDQALLDSYQNNFYAQQQMPLTQAGAVSNVISPIASGFGTTNTTGTGAPSQLPQIAGQLGAAWINSSGS